MTTLPEHPQLSLIQGPDEKKHIADLLPLLRCFLRYPPRAEQPTQDDEDEEKLLLHCVRTAMHLVQEMSERTLLACTWEMTSPNTNVYLLFPPVKEVRKVTNRGKPLTKEEDYVVKKKGAHTVVEVLNSKFLNPIITVEYTAGYEKIDDIPPTFVHLILYLASMVYTHRDDRQQPDKLNKILRSALESVQVHRDLAPITLMPELYKKSAVNG